MINLITSYCLIGLGLFWWMVFFQYHGIDMEMGNGKGVGTWLMLNIIMWPITFFGMMAMLAKHALKD